VDNDHLSLGHFLNRVARALFAHAAVFQTAVGHQVGAPLRAPIDMYIASVHLLSVLQCPIDIFCKYGGAQAVIRIVGCGNGTVDIVKAANGHGWAKYFVARYAHFRIDIGNNGRLVHGALTAAARN